MIRHTLNTLLLIAGIVTAADIRMSRASETNNPFSGAVAINIAMARDIEGIASWYGRESGTTTASGTHFDPEGNTCAMRTHRWHFVTVTVKATGKSARCYVNDFGPRPSTGAIIDVSHGIARKLGMLEQGRARVLVSAE